MTLADLLHRIHAGGFITITDDVMLPPNVTFPSQQQIKDALSRDLLAKFHKHVGLPPMCSACGAAVHGDGFLCAHCGVLTCEDCRELHTRCPQAD